MEEMQEKQDAFGTLFVLTNRLQTLIDRDMRPHGLSAKQWFLLAVLERFFEEPPNLRELGERMGTSYQNAKGLCERLARGGWVELVRDEEDRRSIRVQLVRRDDAMRRMQNDQAGRLLDALFVSFSPEELQRFLGDLGKLSRAVARMEGERS